MKRRTASKHLVVILTAMGHRISMEWCPIFRKKGAVPAIGFVTCRIFLFRSSAATFNHTEAQTLTPICRRHFQMRCLNSKCDNFALDFTKFFPKVGIIWIGADLIRWRVNAALGGWRGELKEVTALTPCLPKRIFSATQIKRYLTSVAPCYFHPNVINDHHKKREFGRLCDCKSHNIWRFRMVHWILQFPFIIMQLKFWLGQYWHFLNCKSNVTFTNWSHILAAVLVI